MRTSTQIAPAMAGAARAGIELKLGDGLYGSLAAFALGLLVTGIPILFHLASQAAAIAACIVLSAILASLVPRAVPLVVIFSYQFQNLFVALVSPQIGSLEQLNSIRAYNFLLTAVVWVVLAGGYWLERPTVDRRVRLLMDVTTVALLVIGGYFLLGLPANPSNALVYLRNIAAPFLLIQIFAVVGYRHQVSVASAAMLVALLAVVYGYLELFGQAELLRLVNGDTYLAWRMKQEYEAGVWLRELQETGRVMRGYLDALEIDFLNTPLLLDLGLRLYRLVGPNFHAISFAYALAVLGITLCATGRSWYLLLAFPLVVVIGSKGALVLLIFVSGSLLLLAWSRHVRRLWLFMGLLCAYAAAGIAAGIATSDYHVIGFIGGLRGFLSNPIGHGIGAGGNLSLTVAAIDWSRSQGLGHTDVAVESAIGVLLYQMGVAAILIVGAMVWTAARLWHVYKRTGDRVYAAAALGILVITVNGIFQEEALFAPLALGIMGALAGLLLGSAYRILPADAAGVKARRLAARPVYHIRT
jgi:hypothetical protein